MLIMKLLYSFSFPLWSIHEFSEKKMLFLSWDSVAVLKILQLLLKIWKLYYVTILVYNMNTYIIYMYTFAVLFIYFRLPNLEKQKHTHFSCCFCFLLIAFSKNQEVMLSCCRQKQKWEYSSAFNRNRKSGHQSVQSRI